MYDDIIAIPAFEDNYIWLLVDGKQAIVVDPGEATPVFNYLKQHDLSLTGVLITHHHLDHTAGVQALVSDYACPVYGPATIDVVDHPLSDGDNIHIAGNTFEIIAVPGHTLDHIAYYDGSNLFCGDTLFSAGCGRLFEGSAAQMYQSLQKIAQLPSDTAIYCTHEYTLANLAFAQTVEPDNQHIRQYREQVSQRRQQLLPSLPTYLAQERKINPFLRCHEPQVIEYAKQQSDVLASDEVNIFALLRKCKDRFRA